MENTEQQSRTRQIRPPRYAATSQETAMLTFAQSLMDHVANNERPAFDMVDKTLSAYTDAKTEVMMQIQESHNQYDKDHHMPQVARETAYREYVAERQQLLDSWHNTPVGQRRAVGKRLFRLPVPEAIKESGVYQQKVFTIDTL